LGCTEYALASGDRFFRAKLADELSARVASEICLAPVLQFRGIGVNTEGSARANNIQILGVDERFWRLGSATKYEIGSDDAVINTALASKLGLKSGDVLLVRIAKPSALPADVPLTSDRNATVAIRLNVKAVASDTEFGRFSLKANQTAPLNVYVSLPVLAGKMGIPGEANAMLAGAKSNAHVNVSEMDRVIKQTWQLADAGLELKQLPGSNGYDLVSNRIFIEPAAADAAMKALPGAKGILTYFVNQFTAGTNSTPYSFASASGEPLVPPDMPDDEIVINEWLAKDLSIGKGDTIELHYYLPEGGRTPTQTSAVFRVRSVVPIAGAAADRELTPVFPGLSDVANCRDWDAGIAVDLGNIRKVDEDYWKEYRGTPKAFVTLRSARSMWGNRFGNLTAVRYLTQENAEDIPARIMKDLDPVSVGLVFLPVREGALRSAGEGTDFGQLFVGLSFFIVVAALLLTGLLFVFGIEQRAQEMGLLLALGFTVRRVRGLLLGEGLVVAVIGAAMGVACGLLYNEAVLRELGTVWRGAVGMSNLHVHVVPSTLFMGFLCGVVMALLAMIAMVRQQSLKSVAQLQKAGGAAVQGGGSRPMASLLTMGTCFIGVLAIAVVTPNRQAVAAFFGCGTLLLVGGLAFWNMVLILMERQGNGVKLTTARMGFRNCARRRWRSLAVIALLAAGIFIVVAVGANRQNVSDVERSHSGTGGFSFIGETTMPVAHDLNTEQGKRRLGLDGGKLAGVGFVAMRVHDGDDASCLNLNKVQSPRVLAVKPEELAQRDAFSFKQTITFQDHDQASAASEESPWLLLDRKMDDGSIPAIADETAITWGLGKKLGDTLDYTDEKGRSFKIKLVASLENSIFQGSVLISERAFLERFPSTDGYSFFLLDAPRDQRKKTAEYLVGSLQDYGLDLTPAAQRLAEFNVVENTYLSIFLALGGMGLILGSIGLGVVVLRNVMERRAEMALLRAVGFTRQSLRIMALLEHGFLLVAGLLCGTISAGVAVLPALFARTAHVSFGWLSLVIAGVAANGLLWTALAVVLATRGDLMAALRDE
jgi:putative ABC transport system permease protein